MYPDKIEGGILGVFYKGRAKKISVLLVKQKCHEGNEACAMQYEGNIIIYLPRKGQHLFPR